MASQTVTISLDALPASYPSIYIPRLFTNVEWYRVKIAFEAVGEVERVDLKKYTHQDGKEYNRGYVHFKYWRNTENAKSMRETLLQGNTIQVTYEEMGEKKRYWLVTMSKVNKPQVKTPWQPRHKVVLTESVEKVFESVKGRKGKTEVDAEYAGGSTPKWEPSSPPFEVGNGSEEVPELDL